MKFSSKTFTTPSMLILFALLATFIFYLYFRKSSHDMYLDFYDYDSDESEGDYYEGFNFNNKRMDPVRANKQANKRRRMRKKGRRRR